MSCERLTGRMREICEGTSGLSAAKERAYIERWVASGEVSEDALLRFGARGLGDTVKKFTDATGITKVAKFVEKVTGRPCGCAERQKRLNELLPYRSTVDETPSTTQSADRRNPESPGGTS